MSGARKVRSADDDATIARVEMFLGWTLDEQQKAYLRSALSVRPGASPESLARMIHRFPVTPPQASDS